MPVYPGALRVADNPDRTLLESLLEKQLPVSDYSDGRFHPFSRHDADQKSLTVRAVATADLNRCFGVQKSVGLKSIEKTATPVTFDGIRCEIDKLIAAGQMDLQDA